MKRYISIFLIFISSVCLAEVNKEVFSLLNIGISDIDSLSTYFKNRQNPVIPGFSVDAPISETERKIADDALEHRFYVHAGYQPSFFYGDDIDWQYWPVKDYELRWQLHRMKWWVPLGKAYRASGDEKYAKEWAYEYLDWIKKNPLTEYSGTKDKDMLHVDNVYFAWRPLEVSDRLENQIKQFLLFLPSQHIDGEFISNFLVNYHRHCEHITGNFSNKGNHLLFEAQRLLFASIFFPEFKDAKRWQQTAIEILNREISSQVYPDGMQFELDPHYMLESIKIFFKALQVCDANGLRNVFPDSYINTVRRMIEVVYNYSYPDYCNPMFSDFHGQHDMIPLYKEWAVVFPDDDMIKWLATEGKEGKVPDYQSRAFFESGFYCMRNGWEKDATVMVMKAGPKGEWHCQPDNGTFEYWRKGRNFFPDSGGYVYAGDEEILKMRAWFRQTAVHNTLTLNGENIENPNTHLVSWIETKKSTVVVVETPSYKGLTHRRTVEFYKDGNVVITDKAFGEAEGEVAIHYNLLPCEPKVNLKRHSIETDFKDGNNIKIVVESDSEIFMKEEEGRVSYRYRQYEQRPAYSFTVGKKKNEVITFVTKIVPKR